VRAPTGPRTRLAVVGAAAAAVLGVFAWSGLDDELVYYQTPGEIAAGDAAGERVRLGGLVERGSLRRDGEHIAFVLTDGAHDVPVDYVGTTTAVFGEGQGAVVEGTLTGGVFRADALLVKHSNTYETGDGARYQPPGTADALGSGGR
jgi:cytochrome c-type biogenesis protein CcmE